MSVKLSNIDCDERKVENRYVKSPCSMLRDYFLEMKLKHIYNKNEMSFGWKRRTKLCARENGKIVFINIPTNEKKTPEKALRESELVKGAVLQCRDKNHHRKLLRLKVRFVFVVKRVQTNLSQLGNNPVLKQSRGDCKLPTGKFLNSLKYSKK